MWNCVWFNPLYIEPSLKLNQINWRKTNKKVKDFSKKNIVSLVGFGF